MGYDEDLAHRLRALLGRESVTEKRMFGGLAFLVGGNMAVAASGQGGLLVRADPADSDALLAEPGADEFAMTGRGPMRGWIRVSADALDDDALGRWVHRALTYVKSLPPK